MRHSTSNEGPASGQIVSFPTDASLNDSLSSLGSFMSFEDESEQFSVEIQVEFEVDMQAIPRLGPIKKRSRPRSYGHRIPTTPVSMGGSPLSRTHSSPDLAEGASPRVALPSRWRSKSCESSPAAPQRSSRRLMGGNGRARPTIATGKDATSDSLDCGSAHSATSLKLKSLLQQQQLASSRWAPDESHGGGNNQNNNSSISGRWQDSVATCNESVSRWSTSFTSSQMDQLSTKPRFPRRKTSGLIVGGTMVNTDNVKAAAGKNTEWQSNNGSQNMFHNSSGGSQWDLTDTTATETASFATGRATTGSSAIEDFSTESAGSRSTNKVEVDFGSFVPSTPETPSAAVPRTTRPRPQLPNRQKSFRRGMSMALVAKAAFVNRRAKFVKQRSEPSLPDRQASDLTLTSRASSCISEDDTTASGSDQKKSSYRRQRSMPLPYARISTKSEEKPVVKTSAPAPTLVQTYGLADLRKQKSLSCLSIDVPHLPERQVSETSTLLGDSSRDRGTNTGALQKQKSLSHLALTLPRRLPSEASLRSLNPGESDSPEEASDSSSYEGLLDCSTRVVLAGPPSPPKRQVSREFSGHSKSSSHSKTTTTRLTNMNSTPKVPQVLDDTPIVITAENRRLSLTKQWSEPNALSLKKLMLETREPPASDCRSLDSLLLLERPNKRQALLASWGQGDPHDASTPDLIAECGRLFLPLAQHRLPPERSCSCSGGSA
ncbi:expressed unknown protein [Seminavis robusta]|uniref:Uncharacterized protein n=1 Tax=Seminavis robusta TaxID=568900 RepID=A0A9N8EZK2_9STRA|nr:expressed unknown protein [Seminavis robusta]|eukprot:Sro2105_g314770.1 n/a (717) ;mRNA; f:13768-15918